MVGASILEAAPNLAKLNQELSMLRTGVAGDQTPKILVSKICLK